MLPADEESLPPSKTRRKQEMEELQGLGEELVGLPADRIRKVDLPDDLREAIVEAQRMTRHDEARRRQMQYIGKLMRSADTEPIRAAIALARGESAAETARLHRLERLRSELLDDEKAMQEIVRLYPAIDVQQLRSLRRAALKEKPPGVRNRRAIFQLLKEADAASENDAAEGSPTEGDS